MNELDNPFRPRSRKEQLSVLRLIAGTTFRILRRPDKARYVRGLFSGLADKGIPPKTPSYPGLCVKACIGDIYHQLTASSFDRNRFAMHSMQILTIFNIVDYYIDDLPLPLEEREAVFDDLEYAFLRGERRESQFQRTSRATDIACEFHAEISQMPGAEWYFSQCSELLFDLAREEAFGAPTVETTAQIGRGLIVAVAGILHAHDPQLPARHIEAYGDFWAAVNLIDDVADFEYDRAHGTRTSITVASDPEATARSALSEARALFSACVGNLQGKEILSYMALARLVRSKWDTDFAFEEHLSFQSSG